MHNNLTKNRPSNYSDRTSLGNVGEAYVCTWLAQQGYTIVANNWRKRFGEIDIIVQDDHVIAFVEVKVRRSAYFNLSQVVNKTKQQKIISAAKAFLSGYHHVNKSYRFDVALLIELPTGGFDMTYLPNAFTDARSVW